jgi:hypothetical protein
VSGSTALQLASSSALVGNDFRAVIRLACRALHLDRHYSHQKQGVRMLPRCAPWHRIILSYCRYQFYGSGFAFSRRSPSEPQIEAFQHQYQISRCGDFVDPYNSKTTTPRAQHDDHIATSAGSRIVDNRNTTRFADVFTADSIVSTFLSQNHQVSPPCILHNFLQRIHMQRNLIRRTRIRIRGKYH